MIILDHAQYYQPSIKIERNLEVYLCSDILQKEMKLIDNVEGLCGANKKVLLKR